MSRYWYVALLVLVLATFGPFLADYFWLDDVAWIDAGRQVASAPLSAVLPNGVYPYRPVTALAFAGMQAAWGCTPWAYRAAGLAVHMLNLALALVLLHRLLARDGAAHGGTAHEGAAHEGAAHEGAALAGAALWAVFPAHRWAVLWIADIAGLLGATFALACCLAYERYTRTRRLRDFALALMLCALAMLTKETYLALPLLIPLLDAFRCSAWRRPERAGLLRAAARYAPFALLALAVAVPGVLAAAMRPGTTGEGLLSWRLPSNFARAWLYLAVPFVDPNAVNALGPRAVLLRAAPVALAWLALLWYARSTRAWLFSLWVLVLLLPLAASQFVLLPFKGRYLYLPALGLCAAIAAGGSALLSRWSARAGRVRAARLAPAALLVVIAGLAVFNAQQQSWARVPQDPSSLMYRVTWAGLLGCPLAPDAVRAAARQEGALSLAPAARNVKLDPAHPYYLVNVAGRGLARELEGDPDGARADYLAARLLAERGDLDVRNKESGYFVPQARVLAYLDAALARLDATHGN